MMIKKFGRNIDSNLSKKVLKKFNSVASFILDLQVEILRKRIKRPYLSDKMVYTFKTLAVIFKKLNTQLKIWGTFQVCG